MDRVKFYLNVIFSNFIESIELISKIYFIFDEIFYCTVFATVFAAFKLLCYFDL